MTTMKSAQVLDLDGVSALANAEVPRPVPGKGEMLVEVFAAGVTPTELLWYPTTHNKDGTTRTHAIPGHEFSGVVAQLGERVDGFAIGDEVFGMNDWFADGATAEYCLAVPFCIARKPAHVSHGEAAAVPIGALTAWQGLCDRAHLRAGDRLLIHGAAGAVGVFAVQLGRLRGAEVIATASGRNREFVSQLGATQVIDYQTEAFEQAVCDVDVVFDAVGGDTVQRSWSVLKPGGRLVTIAADSEGTKDQRVKDAFFVVEPKQQQLEEIAALLSTDKLRVFVDAQVLLADAPAAYAGKVKRPHGYGKVVIVTPAYETSSGAETLPG
jgi:NADPH:quinone reductase-like Zn-dependent oxidoreductase